MQRILRSPNLVLRSASMRDGWFIWRLVSHPQVRAHLGGVVPVWRRLWILPRYWRSQQGTQIWTVRCATTRRTIGLCSVARYRDGRALELSYQFRPEFWGRGLAHEAVRTVLDTMPERRVVAETQSANRRSTRLLHRLGFEERKRFMRFGAEQTLFERLGQP